MWRAKIAEIGATTPGSEYVGKEAGTGPGYRKKLIEGNIDDWKFMKRMEINGRENDEAVSSRAKEKSKRVTGIRTSAGGAVSTLGAAQEMRICFAWILLHSKNSLTELEAPILALDTPKPSEAIKGSDYVSTPSYLTLGAAGAQDDCSGPSTTRELRKQTFQKPVYCGYSTDELEDGR